MKVTSRSADDWPALGLAVRWDGGEGAIRESRVVVSAATEKWCVLRARRAILAALGATTRCARAGDAAAAEASVISDAHGSAAYKRELLRVYVARAVRQALRGGAP